MTSEKAPVILKVETEFDPLVEANVNFLTVVSFIAPWSDNCTPSKELTRELLSDPELKQVLFIELDAEEFPSVCKKYSVNSVPTIVFIRNQNVIDRLVGADVRNYAARVINHANDGPSVEGVPVRIVAKSIEENATSGSVDANLPLEERLKQLINQSSVMIFMKGNPAQPRCGFSRQVIEIINNSGVNYKTFDILEDEEVRQGLKDFSQWQTYPQIYVNGTLVGGLDILRDMKETGDLDDVLAGKNI